MPEAVATPIFVRVRGLGVLNSSLGLALLAAIASISLNGSTWAELMKLAWNSSTYTHCLVIVPIAAWLMWRQRIELAAIAPHFCVPALLATAVVGMLAWLARLVGVQVLEQAAVVAGVPLAIWGVCGTRFARRAAFPLGFLAFAIPFGDSIVPALMEWTADFAVGGLRVFGIPVFRDGLLFSVPSGDFLVAEACSGIRYLIATLALAALYGHLVFRTTRWRAAFFAIAVVVPLVANGIRALGIVLLAYYSNMRIAAGVDHLIYGWLFFGVVALLLFWVGSLMRKREAVAIPPEPAPAPIPVQSGLGIKPAASVAVLALAIAVGPALRLFAAPSETMGGSHQPSLPEHLGEWQSSAELPERWPTAFSGASGELRRLYQRGETTLAVFAATYQRQSQGAEAANSTNELFADARWRLIREEPVHLTSTDGELSFLVKTYRDTRSERQAWIWYVVGDTATGNQWHATALTAWQLLTASDDGAAFVAVVAESAAGDDARRDIEQFLTVHARQLGACLTAAGQRHGRCGERL
jgi:exosortase A